MNNPIWNKIKQLFFESKDKEAHPADSKEKLSLFHWLIIIACLGLGAMILHNFFSIQEELSPAAKSISQEPISETIGAARSSPITMEEYEEAIKNQLTEILSKIVGVGEVAVMVTLDSTEEIVIEKDKNTRDSKVNEKDREGGSRVSEDQQIDEKVVIIRNGNEEKPIVVTTKKPRVRGVLVVANGADNMQVKSWIIEAVQRVLDVPAHRISVLPKRK